LNSRVAVCGVFYAVQAIADIQYAESGSRQLVLPRTSVFLKKKKKEKEK
jgi:hypothetical protein